ncbi:hypothetical protein OH76DRAFT_330686 [Lentinus brumalis]|uniref:Uncharacterized protein n=1 Tax=Lentinus brumalis TaxID=2498619 RepID=A0A371DFQ5_9APHY|nr:hypothetical protein OH76DRAFT_330686 [Polyporus brumalis]
MVAFGYCTWAAFAALRAFALSRDWLLSTAIFVLSIGPVAINLARSGYGLSGVNFPRIGCVVANPALNETIKRVFTGLSRGCLMSADVLLIYITWSRLPTRFARGTNLEERSFAGVLRRDGTVYFIILLLMNSLHLTVTLLALQPVFEGTSYVTVFTEPITAILVSRFLLDLQSVELTSLGHIDASTDTGSMGVAEDHSLVFRFMGSLASTIEPGAHDTSSLDTALDDTELPIDLAEGGLEKLDGGSILEVQRSADGITYSSA